MIRKLVLFFVVVLLVCAGGAWWMWTALDTPHRGFTGAEVFVELPAGSSVSAMADRLTSAGVIANPFTFRVAARLSGAERRLQAGEYRFVEPATPYEIVDRLARGDVFVQPITFPEGLTAREMAALFETSGLGTAREFMDAGTAVELIADIDPGARTLEGYLFPDTYTLSRQASAKTTVQAMVARFEKAFDETLRQQVAASGLTTREVVTLASLIEKETAVAAEREIVAAVYRNRLRIGMPLQCDPTVIYAMMLAGRWDGNIRRADLQMDSPYNTYRYPGLPPGPIASPGRPALEAALNPADVPYLYFVSRNDGTHVFSSTLAEHNRNVDTWQRRGRN